MMQKQDFVPALMCQIEISRPLPTISTMRPDGNGRYQRAVALVLLFGRPVGVVEFAPDDHDLSAAACADQIWEQVGMTIQARLREEKLPIMMELTAQGLPSFGRSKSVTERKAILDDAPYVSVVVATHDRPDGLARCLDSLLAMEYPHFDVIVVDNAPSSNETAVLIETQYSHTGKVRYLYEPTPGLSIAHNRGLREVTAPIVAFTDDDVVVNQDWLTHIVRSFVMNQRVGCVTGMIWPAELETPAQAWLEQYGGFSKGFERKLFDLDGHKVDGTLYPFTAGQFGSGANMAFNTAVLREIGGFDPALGAGSRGMGGDDLAAFFQIITANYRLLYEPAAIIRHWHYREYSRLQRTAFGYGVGLTAYLTSCLVKRPSYLLHFLVRIPFGVAYAFSPDSNKNKNKQEDYPAELTRIERKGMVHGPLSYLRSWWQTRHLRFN